MATIIPISDPGDPRLSDYRAIREAHLRAGGGEGGGGGRGAGYPGPFIAEGEVVVRQLVEAGLAVRSVLTTLARLRTVEDALARLPEATPVYTVEQGVMNTVAGFNIHRGLLASGERPAPRDPRALLAAARAAVVLEDLANHDNVGGIFRAAAALIGPSHAAVLYSPRTCDPFYRKAIRVSVGTALRVPSARLDPWPEALSVVREAGFTLVALTPHPAATPLDRLPPVPRPALLLGAEGPGLSGAALARADLRVRIPIAPEVDSLNVAVAAAIALHRLCPAPGAS
ncbi:MAG: RNA methyltransferase [Phycisphaerales bacterium]